jgi:hypothetical protein
MGCRGASDCTAPETCVNHACAIACIGQSLCPDSGDPCQVGTCNADGTCLYHAAADGTQCASDGNECTADRCGGGKCTHAPLADGMACTADSNPCTLDVCMTGACAHPAAPEGTSCGGRNVCSNLMCITPAGTCVPQAGTNMFVITTAHGGSTTDTNCFCNTLSTPTYLASGTGNVTANFVACPTACKQNVPGFTVLCW